MNAGKILISKFFIRSTSALVTLLLFEFCPTAITQTAGDTNSLHWPLIRTLTVPAEMGEEKLATIYLNRHYILPRRPVFF